jgi:hypothetical protein
VIRAFFLCDLQEVAMKAQTDAKAGSGSGAKRQGGKRAGNTVPGSMGNTPGTNPGNSRHTKGQADQHQSREQVGQNDRSLGQHVRRHEQDRHPDQNDSGRRPSRREN